MRVPGGVVGGGWVRWVTDVKEGMFWVGHWVLYVDDELLDSAPETCAALDECQPVYVLS